MSDLPASWSAATINDFTSYVQRGKSPRYSERSDLPVINQRCIRWSGVDERYVKFVSPEQWSAWGAERTLRRGDILWNSTGTGTIGRAALFIELPPFNRVVADSHVTVVRVNSAVNPHYLLNYIKSPSVRSRIDQMQTGSTNQVELGREEILRTEVPVAPLHEQRRIVAKIDSLSAKSGRARDHLEHIPRLVETYKRALLSRVYQEAFGKTDKISTLGAVATEVRNGLSRRPADGPPGIPILRISAIRDRLVRLDERRFYPPDEPVPSNALLRNGDLLFTRYNGNPELTALCGMVRNLDGPLTYPDKLIRVRCRDLANPAFIEIVSSAPQSRAWLAPHIKSAAGQHGISGADLKCLPMPTVALSVQHEIVRRIESAFTWIDRLAKEATSARKLVDHLDQAVLAKAFRGELVQQDPNDEPASALLERIRAEAGTSPQGGRKRRARVA